MKFTIVFLLLISTAFIPVKSQDEESVQENIEEVEYRIADINDHEEATNILISSVRKDLKRLKENSPQNISSNIDSLYLLISIYTIEYIQSLSSQSLKNTNSTIQAFSSDIKAIQSSFNSDIKKLQDIEDIIKEENIYWTQFLLFVNESDDVAQSLVERVELIITNLNYSRSVLSEVMKIELDNSSLYSQFYTELNVIQDLILDQDKVLRNSYLICDDEPIWRINKIARDTTNTRVKTKNVFTENTEALSLYVRFNKNILLTHFLIIILLYLLFKHSQKLTNSKIPKQSAEYIFPFTASPFTTAYLFSFLFISISSSSYPVILIEFYLVTLFAPIYHLLKSYIKPKNRKYIIFFIILFTIQLFLNHISYIYISGRIYLLIIELLIFSYLVFIILKFRNSRLSDNQKLLRNGFILSAALFFSSVIANIFGVVKLSLLLSVSTINIIGIGMLIFLFFQICKAFYIILAEIRPFSKFNILKEQKELVLKWINNITRIILIFLFIRSIFRQFKLLNTFINIWQDFVTKSWELGQVSITISDFINFFILVTITIYFSRFLRYILKSEILPLVFSKRGIPNAISTTVYYTVLVIGFFIAAFSTGVEWSKVNLALGAIGVGIGFGLQGLVYNFIAGLILIYERPVQEGDIVQIDTLMGNIKTIGVRSSRVQTYDGAEVVVPNGNLISNQVINWTLSNNNKRQELKFKASTNANPKEIVEILKTIPLLNPKVINNPHPLALFEGYGDDATLDFRLLFWTHVDVGLSSKSEVALAIYDELQKRGYELPVQKSIIRIEGSNVEKTKNGI